MKKKIIKLIILVVLLSIIPVFPKAEDKAENGDLRCPTKYLNNGCTEFKENGKVVRVETTEQKYNPNITVKKIVSKTEKNGQFTVQFNVKGDVPASEKAYIYLVLDASTTMGNNYLNKVVPATIKFSDQLQGKNIKFGFASFYCTPGRTGCGNSQILAHRGFEKNIFSKEMFRDNCISYNQKNNQREYGETCPPINSDDKKWYSGSPINVGLVKAENAFRNITGNKILVILGDGKYNKNILSSANTITGRLKTDDVIIYIVDYSTEDEYHNNLVEMSSGDDGSDYIVRRSIKEVDKAIEEIANKIKINSKYVSVSIADTVGDDFKVLKNATTSFSDTKNQIYRSDGWTTKSFTISINGNEISKDGWHITNGKSTSKNPIGYVLTDGDNNELIKSRINPEVYWEKEKGWEACSDTASSSNSSVYTGNFVTKICTQSDGDGIKGFYASLTTRGEQINTKKINLEYGEGFPVEINIQSRVQCIYKFDAEAFTNAYNTKQQEINNSKNDKEKATKTKELEKIIKEVKSYIDGLDKHNNLDSYQKKFENMTAILQINYKKSGSVEKEFENSKINYNDIECTGDQQSDISFDGKTSKIYTDRTCTLKSSKTLVLSKTCLSMIDGNVEECSSSSKTQLDGGNKFYPSTDKTGGYISASLKEATFAGLDINLSGKSKSDSKNPNCEFSMEEYNNRSHPVIYRQIELSDPFVSSNKKRKTGQNWINNKYDFSGIIKKEIWDNDKNYEYQYYISKTDIDTIKNDTSGDVNNYLGQNCTFSSNKWICSFVRPTKGKKGSSNYFTEMRIN